MRAISELSKSLIKTDRENLTMITFSRFRTQINEILNYKKINILQKASPGLLINEKKMRL